MKTNPQELALAPCCNKGGCYYTWLVATSWMLLIQSTDVSLTFKNNLMRVNLKFGPQETN